jgi:hypothetical protein
LTSPSKLTESEIARQIYVSELRVCRAAAKFAKFANLDPAGGLRSLAQPTNGVPGLKENGQRGL